MLQPRRLAAAFLVPLLAIGPARAAPELSRFSAAISLLPVASLFIGASALSSAAAAVPAALEASGTLVVRGVEASAKGTVYVLERVSDGARASVEVAGRSSEASQAVGTAVLVTVLSAGTMLSVGGEVIAFIPNELGRALLHNERLTP